MEDRQTLTSLSEALVSYATYSNDILPLVEGLPDASRIHRPTMEYELRLLKILSVGWGLAFLLSDHPAKTPLSEEFWQRIALLSKEIDTLCKESGTEINYFTALRKRLDLYVSALAKTKSQKDPGSEVGLCYAELCGDTHDSYALITGKRIFTGVLSSLHLYLGQHFELSSPSSF